jgi:hypothetical protein
LNSVNPRLETLHEPQRLLWPQLSVLGKEFVLYGGTALSLQLGGRISADFDLFTPGPVDHEHLSERIPFLKGARLRQRASNTATFAVDSKGTAVAVSFFGRLDFGRVGEPIRFSDNGVYAAALLDIAVQKVKVIQQRAEAKDYADIHALLSAGITLEAALGAAEALYPGFNPAISLKALSYFKDVSGLAPSVQSDLAAAASRVKGIAEISKKSGSLLPDF